MANSINISPIFALITIFAIFVPQPINAASAPAIFVFGDSSSDVGTNPNLDGCTIAPMKPPYGMNFPNQTLTGRWSDGFNIIDYLSELMVEFLDKSPEAYAEQVKNDKPDKFKSGVNFASAGSGLLNESGAQWGVRSMHGQVEDFIAVRDYLYKQWGPYTYSYKISKSIFLISIGTNDIMNNFDMDNNKPYVDLRTFIDKLLDAYRTYIQKLYDGGARKLAVVSVLAMGCCPGQRRFSPTLDCDDAQNDVSLEFYSELDNLLTGFQHNHPNFYYALGNTYEMMMNAIEGKSLHDLKNLTSACCGIHLSNKPSENIACGDEGATTCCENPDVYAFWDGYHPTSAAAKYMAETLYYGNDTHLPKFIAPITYKQLVTEI